MILFLLLTNLITLYMLYKVTRPNEAYTENFIEFTTKDKEIIYGLIIDNKCYIKDEDLFKLTESHDKKSSWVYFRKDRILCDRGWGSVIVTSVNIANSFLQKSFEEDIPLTVLKLDKLIYNKLQGKPLTGG